jgi:hypothetical protein
LTHDGDGDVDRASGADKTSAGMRLSPKKGTKSLITLESFAGISKKILFIAI